MADAFIYFFLIGSGLASGIGAVGFIGWRIFERSKRKQGKKAAKKGAVRNVVQA